MGKNKDAIKKVLFKETISESLFSCESDKLLFKPNKWYDVEYESKDGLIYLFCEDGEKIAIHPQDLNDKIIIQR